MKFFRRKIADVSVVAYATWAKLYRYAFESGLVS